MDFVDIRLVGFLRLWSIVILDLLPSTDTILKILLSLFRLVLVPFPVEPAVLGGPFVPPDVCCNNIDRRFGGSQGGDGGWGGGGGVIA